MTRSPAALRNRSVFKRVFFGARRGLVIGLYVCAIFWLGSFTTSHRFYGAPPPQLLSALGIVAGCTIGTSLFHAVAPHVRGLAGAIALGSLASFPAWGGIVLSATGPHLRVLPIAAVAAGATGLVFGSVLWYHGVRIDGPPAKEH